MHYRVYEYNKCSTCKKALKYLNVKGFSYDKIDITAKPPTLKELKSIYLSDKKGAVGFNIDAWAKLI